MTKLPISGRDAVSLPAYSVLSITVSGGSGFVERLGEPGQPSFGDVAINGSMTIGPFAAPTMHMLRAVPPNALSYDVAPADFPAVTSDVERIVKLTQAQYNALSPVDPATLTICCDQLGQISGAIPSRYFGDVAFLAIVRTCKFAERKQFA